MSITPASSAVMASAPPPRYYAIGQDKTDYQADNFRANMKKAKKFSGFEAYRNASGGDAIEIARRFAEESGLSLNAADIALDHARQEVRQAESDARLKAAGMHSMTSKARAAAEAAAPPAKYQGFGSPEAAKSFAFPQLELLKASITSHNAWVKDFGNGGAQKMREQVWQSNFDAIKRSKPETSDADAIKFADEGLMHYIHNNEGLRGHMPGQGALQSAFDLSGPLVTENADGTLTLNKVQARYNGVLIFEIGADIAQNVDKAA